MTTIHKLNTATKRAFCDNRPHDASSDWGNVTCERCLSYRSPSWKPGTVGGLPIVTLRPRVHIGGEA